MTKNLSWAYQCHARHIFDLFHENVSFRHLCFFPVIHDLLELTRDDRRFYSTSWAKVSSLDDCSSQWLMLRFLLVLLMSYYPRRVSTVRRVFSFHWPLPKPSSCPKLGSVLEADKEKKEKVFQGDIWATVSVALKDSSWWGPLWLMQTNLNPSFYYIYASLSRFITDLGAVKGNMIDPSV